MLVVLLIWVNGVLGPFVHFTDVDECASVAREYSSLSINVKTTCVMRGNVA